CGTGSRPSCWPTRPAWSALPVFPKTRRTCHDRPMTDSASSTATFRAARDLLLSYRDDYESARREFGWPELDEFNWALDWFDVIAGEHPDRPALRIVADDGFDASLSYGELATRSGQVAN